MFLLNLHMKHLIIIERSTLHPIMFLLNRIHTKDDAVPLTFTSHYVPIKSVDMTARSMANVYFTSHYVPIKSHTYIILYFLRFSTPFLSTPEKTSQVDVRNLLNYLLTTLLTPHESMDCQLPHKNALS